eukprot:2323800-Amphidinium_carterae.1
MAYESVKLACGLLLTSFAQIREKQLTPRTTTNPTQRGRAKMTANFWDKIVFQSESCDFVS